MTSEANGFAGAALNLSELFNPGTFLMALRQQTARVANFAMDGLSLSSSFGNDLDSAPLAIKLSGLLLQGASFSGGVLELSQADAVEMCSVSSCTLAFLPASKSATSSKRSSQLKAPVYF